MNRFLVLRCGLRNTGAVQQARQWGMTGPRDQFKKLRHQRFRSPYTKVEDTVRLLGPQRSPLAGIVLPAVPKPWTAPGLAPSLQAQLRQAAGLGPQPGVWALTRMVAGLQSPVRALDPLTSHGLFGATAQAALGAVYRSAHGVYPPVLRVAPDVTRLLQQQQAWHTRVAQMIAGMGRGASAAAAAQTALQVARDTVERLHGGRAQEVCDLVTPHGWSVDALMLVTGDDALATLHGELATQGPGGYARALAALVVAGAGDLKGAVREATHRLLPPEVANDFVRPFEEAVDALVADRGVSLVAATMLARAEGLFTRALKARGHFPGRKGMLFSNQAQARHDREQVVALLDDAMQDQPARGPRVLVVATARPRFEQARDLMAERYTELQVDPAEAPMSRHHVLHDGYGSGAYPEALRATLFYANIVLFLDQRLPPLDSATPGQPLTPDPAS